MKGILFRPAIWAAKKKVLEQYGMAVTRRAGKRLAGINQEPDKWEVMPVITDSWIPSLWNFFWHDDFDHAIDIKPRYQVGEVVYVKEAWRITSISDDFEELLINYGDGFENWKAVPDDLAMYYYNHYFKAKRRPPTLFMPAWAARHFIKITDVRAERLQEIRCSHFEWIEEGCPLPFEGTITWAMSADDWYVKLWNSINKDYPFESNPWVFRYEFIEGKPTSG